MDERELRKLLQTKNGCRVPPMRPIPDVHVMDELPFTPLPPYSRLKDKQANFRKILEKKATERKVKVAKPPLERYERENLEISQSRHIAVLRECAQKIQPPPMSKDWERKILGLVPAKLRHTYPVLMDELVGESKDEWNRNLHDLAVKTIIRDEPGVSRVRYQEPYFKFNGITDNFDFMLRCRRKLADGALVLHPFIRLVLESSERVFPEFIINLAKYRARGPISLDVFLAKVLEEIKRADYLVSSTWYNILVQWLKNPRCLRGMRTKKIPNFVRCATKMISMQIQELMRRSIDAIIDGLADPETVLILNLDLDFDGDFFYDPSLEHVYEVFHSIADAISNMSQRLMPIEQYLKIPYNFDALPVQYNDWLHKDGHKRLQKTLDEVFEPLLSYLDSLREEYSMLYGAPAKAAINKFIKEAKKFEVARDKIKYFQGIDSEITAVVENEYFNCAVVRQLRMVDGLKSKALEFVNDLIAGIISDHINENDSICAAFEEIKARALKEPENAVELIEQGIYILHAKTVLVEDLKERIMAQINIISNLLEMTSLTEEHVASNTRTVNWLKDIKPIFEKNAAAYEAHKGDMEENLQAKIMSLNKEVVDMIPYLELLDNMDDIDHTLEYLEYLRKLVHRLDDCDKLVAWINTEEATFKFPITNYPDLEELKEAIKPFHNLIYLVHKWKRSFYTWMDGPFEYLDHVQIEMDHDFYYKEFLKISKNYRQKIKQQIAEGVEKRFQGLVDDPDVNNLPAPMKLCAQAVHEIKDWRPNVQMAHIMCNPALVQRHWDEMTQIAGFDLTPTAGTTLRKIIQFNLWDDIDQYEIISVAATKELALITNLNKMMAEWGDICFKTSPYKDTGIHILSGLDDIQSVLDDHIIKTIGMRGSAFVKPFESQVKSWYEKITRANATIDEWGKVQSQWLYLLPIFSSKDIVAQMPEEGVMFTEVNNVYRRYMGSVEKDPHALELAGATGVLESLKVATGLLDKINDGVNNYLEKKRLYFPRFFFLSNDEMLEILSETKNPLKVQPHLKKCFEGINKLVFDEEFNISAMISMEGEQVEFLEIISVQAARGSVEKWLVQVEDQMLKAVRSETELSYYDYPNISRADWILSWEGMVVLAISQIYWAVDVHEALQTHQLSELEAFHLTLSKQLNETVAVIRRTDLTKLNSITVKALIVIDVHAKDVIFELVGKNVTEVTDFQWLAQLRYYWEEEKVTVKIINAVVAYAYEYLDTYQAPNGEVTRDTIKNMMFGCYLDTDSLEGERRYEEMPSKDAVLKVAVSMLTEYNAMHKAKMTIVLFDYALEHLSKPEITKTYSVKDWQDDIKLVLREAGGLNKDTTFLFSESQIKEEVYIQNLDSLLNSGEVPNLYGLDEKQEILELVRLAAQGDRLGQAADAVTIMQRDLNALKPQLMIMAAKSAKMMEEIATETAIADKAAAQVREDQKVANVQAAAAQELKKDCEADLALALPILEDAIAALNTLKPADITIVKSMKNPPSTVKLVMAAVCVIKGIPPDKIPDPANPGKKILDYWGPSKRILGDMSFLDSLRNFDKDNIPIAIMQKIRKEYLSNKDFKPHIIAKASAAAEGLCKWIIAMDMYDAVAKVVAPKKAKLEAAEREFAETMAILEEKKALVARLEAKLAELNEALEEANIKKKQLEDEVQLCIDKLYRAEKLIGGLGGERVRWTTAAENLQTLYDNLAGDILVSCGIMAYLSPYTLPIRIKIIDKWRDFVINLNMPHSTHFVFKDVLGTDIKIQNWCIAGLPRDSFSVDNGIIQDNSMRWSLLVDPQGQANKWIKTMEKHNDLQVLKFTDGNYMKVIETCLEYGKPALIECILEDVEAPLDPVLLKNTYTQGGKEFIALGDNVIEYHPHFRLYMTTKLRNPHYLPEIFNKVTLINFALTKDGLEDQLLGIVVAKERPDLQEKREKLIVQSAANRAALKQVEDDILRTLQETKGDILEDESAVEVLDSSKLLAIDIMKKQEASVETEVIIEKFRHVVQERKKFGPLGWNIQYGFNDSDFQISVMQLQMFLNQYEEIQYVAIKYLTGECNYGGRVTDDWDRRLIVTILDNYVNPNVVNDPNYTFCDIGNQYGLPRRCEYQDYLKHIESVPVNPPPEVFGLHMNAGITRDYTTSMAITEALVLVEGAGGGGGEGNTEVILVQMAAEILSKLPQKFDVETAQQKYPVDYNESMNTVLIQEMERFNKLLCEIETSLMDLQKAVKGLIVMSPGLELQSIAMLLGKIPENWRKVSYPSLKPLPSYVTDFIERLEMLDDWYQNGKPATFWLSGFFFTQAFLTGSVQNYARAKKIPIDLLIFDFQVLDVDMETSHPTWGVYVSGLFMDGGRWDRRLHAIAEQFPKILNDNMPAMWLFPKLKSEFEEGTRYKCPLYKTLERKGVLATTGHSSNFVLAFFLPSDKPSAHWIKRSVALLLQLDF
ncbi:unnamed protein product [Chrysodeixis includens]|uniref:Uncharacterized protein n=1 Tax=Chrysodeixis includens TaxID=689277 RepID=A0A9P0BUJ5_CHRIL|nr:unnamed protein product [Chrysodeixis includens]